MLPELYGERGDKFRDENFTWVPHISSAAGRRSDRCGIKTRRYGWSLSTYDLHVVCFIGPLISAAVTV